MSPRLEPGACSVCGGGDLVAHFAVAGEAGPDGLIPTSGRFGTALADIVRCRRCGHMQLERLPSEEELDRAYAEAVSEDYVEEELGQRATARDALTRIERHVGRGRLLDVGAWTGYMVAEANARGWRASGIEPSRFASRFAREHLGVDVQTTTLSEAGLPEGQLEAVTLGDVIEHLPDPGQVLDRVSRLLAPQGVIWLALPDAGSRLARAMGRRWWSVLPTHVHYFTRETITALLSSRGYEVLEVGTAPKAFTVRYYLARIGGYSPPAARILVGAAQAAGVADRLWTPDFRDRMMVLARPSR